MDYLSIIKQPISTEIADFIEIFNQSLTHEDGMLGQALEHIRQRTGKRMRPILILLIAKCFGKISPVTQHAAVGLELLHTASLVHDDVVDESDKRRGKKSANAVYDNKMAVLLGDFIVSMALIQITATANIKSVDALSTLTHADNAVAFGRRMCEKLKELIPRQQFDIAIQAAIGAKIIARETVKQVRKDVTAKCYGGDVSRKRKLLEKQKKGKKRMKQIGNVEVPQKAFLAVLKLD